MSTIIDLLEREAALIKAADFDGLRVLANEKEIAVATFSEGLHDKATLKKIKKLSIRNDRLLTAARAGLEAASARIAAASRGSEIDTYTTDGAKRTIGKGKSTVQRRV